MNVVVLLALLLASLVGEAQATEESGPKVILVLDASGSMWAHVLDDRPRIAVAREVIRDILADWDPETLLGLTAYGHRTKGDCQDIETLIPVGPVDRERFAKTVDGVSPKGKTPLSEAVRRAAAELKYTEEKATVVLVSDGEETCNLDPCAVAEELERQGVDFTAHVIGFSLVTKVAQDQLRCLAEKTGGRFLLAEDAGSLKDALRTVVRVAEGKPEQETDVAEAPPPAPPTAKPVASKTGLKLVAVLSQGGKPIEDGIRWHVSREGEPKALETSHYPSPFVELPPGRYTVRAKRGEATREVTVEIGEGEARRTEVVLGAGRLKLLARLGADQPPVRDGARWEIYESRIEDEDDGRGERVALSYDAQPVFTLPAGLYIVSVKRGDAHAETEVEIAAGDEKRQEVVIGAGRIKLTPKLSASGPPIRGKIAWRVFEAEEDIEGKRKRVALSYEDSPVFTLGTGRYLVEAKRGDARAAIEVEAAAGEDQRLDLVLDAGVVTLTARSAKGSPAITGMTWDVFETEEDIQGKRKKITVSYDDVPTLTLNAGRYHVVARKGATKSSIEIEVKAGDKTEVEVLVDEPQ